MRGCLLLVLVLTSALDLGRAAPTFATDMDLVFRGVGVPTDSFYGMMDESVEHEIEFDLAAWTESRTPCLQLSEGRWTVHAYLSDNQEPWFQDFWYGLPFAALRVEISFYTFGPHQFPTIVLVAEGGSAEIRWHSEWGGYELTANASVIQRAVFGPDCSTATLESVSGETVSLSATLIEHEPESSGPLFSAEGRVWNAVRIVPTESASWGSVKELYR